MRFSRFSSPPRHVDKPIQSPENPRFLKTNTTEKSRRANFQRRAHGGATAKERLRKYRIHMYWWVLVGVMSLPREAFNERVRFLFKKVPCFFGRLRMFFFLVGWPFVVLTKVYKGLCSLVALWSILNVELQVPEKNQWKRKKQNIEKTNQKLHGQFLYFPSGLP